MQKAQLENSNTLEKIKEIAYDEFMTKGFRKASLRQIVKKAGVTTGAFYGYFDSKEELLSVLIGDYVEKVMSILGKNIMKYIERAEYRNIFSVTKEEMDEILQALREIYKHRDAMKFIVSSSEVTKYENYLERFAAQRVSYHCGHDDDALYTLSHQLNRHLLYHIFCGMYYAFWELAFYDLREDEFITNALDLWTFYAMGYSYLTGIETPRIEVKK